jgi:AraC family transcriptional regulator, regulatory protein of adaptative response / DNA-3-methyladenine glycosylase II
MFDDDYCFRAIQSRDGRFDGWFFTAVTTTGIYCRPSCPAITPKRANVRFFPSAAAAHSAGFRACKRCRPDASPGSPEWNYRADVVGRAMRLIADGIVDRGGVADLAFRLGYSERHLNRMLLAEVGAGPLAIARAQRAQTARLLLETTDLPITSVAFAAGFASTRQFNDTIRSVFDLTPTALRHRALPVNVAQSASGSIAIRLPYRPPLAAERLFGFLALRAIPGVEAGDSGSYRRTLALPNGAATVELHNAGDHVACRLRLDDVRDLGAAVQRSRRLLDLDADPEAVDGQLGSDPLLGRMVDAHPGLRSPGAVDAPELAIRAVLGQQVSVASARAQAARLVRSAGRPLRTPSGTLTHLFPTPEALGAMDPETLPMTRAKGRAVVGLAQALADGKIVLDPGVDREEVSAKLMELDGIGPWTAAYIRLRALGDPDVFMPSDLGIRKALERLGAAGDPKTAGELAERWRPWRSYALHHLWLSLSQERIPA